MIERDGDEIFPRTPHRVTHFRFLTKLTCVEYSFTPTNMTRLKQFMCYVQGAPKYRYAVIYQMANGINERMKIDKRTDRL